MAASENELAIRLRAILTDFTNPMKEAGAVVKEFGATASETFERIEGRAENLKHVWKDMLEAFIGIEIIESLKKIAEAASGASDALEIAGQTTKNFGHAFDAEEMESWLQKLAKSAQGGGFAINELRESIQALSTTGATEEQQQRLLVDAIGLAAAKHISLAEATHIAVEAATGHVEMLGRYGIQVKDAEGKTLSFAQVMQNWEAMVAGDAEKRAESLEGAFGRLSTTLNNLATGPFGRTLTAIFVGATTAIGNFLNVVASLPAPVLEFSAAVLATLAGLTAVTTLLPATKLAFEFLGAGIAGTRDIIVGFGTLLAKLPALFEGARLAAIGFRDALIGIDLAALVVEAPIAVIVAIIAALVAVVVEAVRGFQDLKRGWDGLASSPVGKWMEGAAQKVRDFFVPKLDNVKVPKPDWAGLGGPAKENGQKAIDDWLTAMLAAVDAFLAKATLKVEQAKAKLDETTAKLETVRAKRDPKALISQASNSEEEALITEEMERQRDVQIAINAQRAAQLAAVHQLAEIEAKLPANDTDRVKHLADIQKQMAAHTLEASRLNAESIKLSGTIAKIGQELRTVAKAWADQQLEVNFRLPAERSANDREGDIREAQAQDKYQYERSHAAVAAKPKDAAEEAIRQAGFELALRKLANELALTELNLAKMRVQTDQSVEAQKALIDAEKSANAALLAVNEAENDLALAHQKLTIAINQSTKSLGTFFQQLAAKLNIPGLSQKTDPISGAFAGFSFNPMTFLLQAFTQSKSFADIMQVVNEIMKTFSQIIDAFRPIIDAALKAVAFVVDIFIDLYNVVAKLLGLLGIHLQLLQQINTNFGNLIPFSQIIHDIPTLNELAAGKLNNPLSLSPLGTDGSLLDPIQSSIASPSLGGGLLGKLVEIVAGVGLVYEAIKLLGGSNLLGGLSGLLGGGGGGGIGSIVSGLFSNGTVNTVLIGGAIAAGIITAFSHKDNPALMPDKYNTQAWGQGLADFQGSGLTTAVMNANGQQFTENSSTAQALGGIGEGQFIANAIKNGMGNMLTSSELKEFSGYQSIVGGKNGNLDLNNGVQVAWNQLISDAQDAVQRLGVTLNSGLSQATSTVGGNLAAYLGNISNVAKSISRSVSSTMNQLAAGSSSSSLAAAGASNVNLTISVPNATVGAGSGSAEDLATEIANKTIYGLRSIGLYSNRISR